MRVLVSILVGIGFYWATIKSAGAGTLDVANTGNNTIHQFSSNGADLGGFPAGGSEPLGLALDQSGNIYVSLYGSSIIEKFSPSGTNLGVFASSGLAAPGGMAFDATGDLYVNNYNTGLGRSETGGGWIEKFSPTGVDLGKVVSVKNNDYFLAMDSKGNLYVDIVGQTSGTGSIHEYSSTGADLGQFGPAIFADPQGMAFDKAGNLYVADSPDDVIREFSSTGTNLGVFTSTGLSAPRDVAFDSAGNLYVSNSGNNTISEYSPTGAYLGNFAVTGLNEPYGLVWANSVPEPSAFTLLGIGTATLIAYRRIVRLAGKRPWRANPS
jgi:sugar lactone lactonase YvrE